MENSIKISLIIPCYNEELNLQKGTLDKVYHYISEHPQICEVLIIDDGSTDETRSIIKKDYIINKYPQLKLIENHHFGKAQAIITGVKNAKGDYVIFTDFDLATPVDEIDKFIIKTQNGHKIVIGSRSNKRQGAPFLRKLQSVGFNFIRNILLRLNDITDTQCGFKMFEKNTALKIISKLIVFQTPKDISAPSVSAGFDLEFLYVAKKLNYKIVEIPINWRHVETKRVNFIKDSIESLIDIFKIKYSDLMKKYD